MRLAAYDNEGIWGVGDTIEQARAEAEGFIIECFPDDPDGAKAAIEELKEAPISEDLLRRIITFNEADGPSKLFCNYTDLPYTIAATGELVFDGDRAEADAAAAAAEANAGPDEEDEEDEAEAEDEDEEDGDPDTSGQDDDAPQQMDAGVPVAAEAMPNLIEQ